MDRLHQLRLDQEVSHCSPRHSYRPAGNTPAGRSDYHHPIRSFNHKSYYSGPLNLPTAPRLQLPPETQTLLGPIEPRGESPFFQQVTPASRP